MPKGFRVLPQSLVEKLLECFATPFKCKRSRLDARMKVCEIGMEGSWLPSVCVQKGIQYEGYMLKPQYAPKIQEELYSSKPISLELVLLNLIFGRVFFGECGNVMFEFRDGSTTHSWETYPSWFGSQPCYDEGTGTGKQFKECALCQLPLTIAFSICLWFSGAKHWYRSSVPL